MTVDDMYWLTPFVLGNKP